MNHVDSAPGDQEPMPGSARLWIAIPVTIFSFFYAQVLEYALPLFFSAWNPGDAQSLWSTLVKYKFAPWIPGPLLAGLLARRYGERAVWCGSLLGMAVIPPILILKPPLWGLIGLSLWQGITAAVMWIAGISLVQMVGPNKRGLANGMTMMAVGVGSLAGPIVGRCMLHGGELSQLLREGAFTEILRRTFNLSPMVTTPEAADFTPIFVLLAVMTTLSGIAIGLWGQRPGHYEQAAAATWSRTVEDLTRLIRTPRFWALVGALCLCGGPIFQASNQFLPIRAEDLGLKHGAHDSGWIWLNLVKTLVWLPGGAAVGYLAGRRAPGIVAALMLLVFAGTSLAIGWSTLAWHLFLTVALYEFVRQFMRWSHSGYMSEHMPSDLRSTAIGLSITFSGLGSTIFLWTADYFYFPKNRPAWADTFFQHISEWMGSTQIAPSTWPFVVAAGIGFLGSAGLYIFDCITPIREPDPPA